MAKRITTPLTDEMIRDLKAGDDVLLTGVIYTARDAAHKRLVTLLDKGEPLPFDMKGATIFYVGPTPPKPGKVIGSAGPTTSGRMDPYALRLMEHGMKGMIGKGKGPRLLRTRWRRTGYFTSRAGAAAPGAQYGQVGEASCIRVGDRGDKELYVEEFP